jgi:hypothetical protein
MIPGTSCLATIVLSLRDKTMRPFEAPRLLSALMSVYPRLCCLPRSLMKGRQNGEQEYEKTRSVARLHSGATFRAPFSWCFPRVNPGLNPGLCFLAPPGRRISYSLKAYT